MGNQEGFFDFAAEVGLTKHFGGIGGTEELVALCHIGQGSYVLDVGCGVGVTPVLLAKRHGCRVVGVDIREAMIERSRERAEREGVADRVELRVADAQDLPFENDLFDAVISESVTAFPKDKQRAVREYARATKPGGFVGLSEVTLLRTPPPPELVAWASQDLGAQVELLTAREWAGLLEGAGLRDIRSGTRSIDVRGESKAILQRYGYGGILGILWRVLALYARKPSYRRFVSQVREGGVTPRDLDEYLGYGVYIGGK